MKTQHYLVRPLFARENDIPTSFVGVVLAESKKALFIHGHGKMDPLGSCACCGRTLTHPGSILIGIGPECLNNWGARDHKLDNMTEEDKAYLRSIVETRKVDQWFPKSIFKQIMETDAVVIPPADHRMISKVEEKTQEATANEIGKISTLPASKPEPVMQARIWKGLITIQFPFNQDTLNKVKSLDGRRYIPDGKYWTCPIKIESITALEGWGFVLDEEMKTTLLSKQTKDTEKKMDAHARALSIDFDNLGLKKTLFPFQKEGVVFMEEKGGRALIGDEMGLGKTIQALAYLQLHPEMRPAVIVCPASLKLNWAKEIRSTLTEANHVTILEGKSAGPFVFIEDIIIINYDILESWLVEIQKINPKIVIADEAHYFKSNKAIRTKSMKLLVKGVPHFLALTGTPIMNRPIEIYNAVCMVDHTAVPSFWNFAKRYCGATHNGFGWSFSGATHTDELHELLTKSVMIRRKKADVLKDLPDKVYSSIPMELDNQKEYDAAERDFVEFVRGTKGDEAAEKASNAQVITQIEGLKQLAVKGKLNGVIEWVHNFLESSDEKLVLFAVHKFVIDRLMDEFRSIAVKIDGSVSSEDRNKAVEAFQTNDSVRLFVGNIKAAGVGLTLTAASNEAFIEYPWTPGEMRQAEDRCHRIGQKNSVNVHLLIAYHTIEGEIVELLDKKTEVLDAVLDGVETQQESLLSSLIKSTLKKN